MAISSIWFCDFLRPPGVTSSFLHKQALLTSRRESLRFEGSTNCNSSRFKCARFRTSSMMTERKERNAEDALDGEFVDVDDNMQVILLFTFCHSFTIFVLYLLYIFVFCFFFFLSFATYKFEQLI